MEKPGNIVPRPDDTPMGANSLQAGWQVPHAYTTGAEQVTNDSPMEPRIFWEGGAQYVVDASGEIFRVLDESAETPADDYAGELGDVDQSRCGKLPRALAWLAGVAVLFCASGVAAHEYAVHHRPSLSQDAQPDRPKTSPAVSTSASSGSTASPGVIAVAAPASDIGCNYQVDTWSGDAKGVGYVVHKVAASKDGSNPASFSVSIDANRGTNEVVGYPSDQCLMYSALPKHLTSSFSIIPPEAFKGEDYEFAYDIWLTTAAAARNNNWDKDLELMVWVYNKGQTPAGDKKAKLADGSKVWYDHDKKTGETIVSVVLSKNETNGTVDISSLVAQLKSIGLVPKADNGILDTEFGIEAPFGGNKTFVVNSVSVSK